MKRLTFLLPLLVATLTVARSQDIQGLVLPFKSVSIASPVLQEVIAKVLVEEGDVVKDGDVLVELRNEKEALEVRQYEQLVKQRKFTAEGAMKLFNERSAARKRRWRKRPEWELAKIQLQQAQVRLEEKTIRSPLSGIVVKTQRNWRGRGLRGEAGGLAISTGYVSFTRRSSQTEARPGVPVRFPCRRRK